MVNLHPPGAGGWPLMGQSSRRGPSSAPRAETGLDIFRMCQQPSLIASQRGCQRLLIGLNNFSLSRFRGAWMCLLEPCTEAVQNCRQVLNGDGHKTSHHCTSASRAFTSATYGATLGRSAAGRLLTTSVSE